jgi:hypothetical protein
VHLVRGEKVVHGDRTRWYQLSPDNGAISFVRREEREQPVCTPPVQAEISVQAVGDRTSSAGVPAEPRTQKLRVSPTPVALLESCSAAVAGTRCRLLRCWYANCRDC